MKKFFEITVITIFCIAVVCIISGAGYVIYQSHRLEDNLNTRTVVLQEELKTFSLSKDTLPLNNPTEIRDAIKSIHKNQIVVCERQERLVDDFRQEMNNNINKMNTWIAYAIGVMSIVGVFIPVVLQIRSHFNEKELMDKVDKAKENLDKDIRKEEECLEEKLNRLSDNINKEEECFKEEFRSLTVKFEKVSEFHELWSNFLCFNHGTEDKLLENIPDRDGILRHIWCRYIDMFEKFIRSLDSNSPIQREMRDKVIIALVMLNSMLRKLMTLNRNRRCVLKATDEIRYILIDIEYGMVNQTTWMEIRERIFELIKELQQLPIRYDANS